MRERGERERDQKQVIIIIIQQGVNARWRSGIMAEIDAGVGPKNWGEPEEDQTISIIKWRLMEA